PAGDAGGRGQRDLPAAGDELQRAEEARRVAGGEQLFGIGARPAGAAELARGGQLHVERAVSGTGAPVAAAGGGGSGGVEDLLDGHGALLGGGGFPGCVPGETYFARTGRTVGVVES